MTDTAIFLLLMGIIALFGFYFFQKIKKQSGNKFVAGLAVALFASLAYTAFPTSREKNPDDRRERIAFLQTDVEIAHLIDEGSWVSSNKVHLAYSTRLLPSSAPLYLDYISKEEPAESNKYTNYLAGTVESLPDIVEFDFENALNYRWVFYTTYTPGPVVHTNGVAVAEFLRVPSSDNVAIPKRSTIWVGPDLGWPKADLLERTNLLEELGDE